MSCELPQDALVTEVQESEPTAVVEHKPDAGLRKVEPAPVTKKKRFRPRFPKKSADEIRRETFVKRSGSIFQNHRRNAKEQGTWLDYEMDDLRSHIKRSIKGGRCPYCNGRMEEDNFSIDHMVPVSRAGHHAIRNLLVCCLTCNMSKGPLDHIEFRQLMNLLNDWSEPVKRHTLARLRAGGAKVKAGRMVPSMANPELPEGPPRNKKKNPDDYKPDMKGQDTDELAADCNGPERRAMDSALRAIRSDAGEVECRDGAVA